MMRRSDTGRPVRSGLNRRVTWALLAMGLLPLLADRLLPGLLGADRSSTSTLLIAAVTVCAALALSRVFAGLVTRPLRRLAERAADTDTGTDTETGTGTGTGPSATSGREPCHGAAGEVADLIRAIDDLLAARAAREAEVLREHTAREEVLKANHARQRDAAMQAQVRAQKVIDETMETIKNELRAVVTDVERVSTAVSEVNARADSAAGTSRQMVDQAAQADQVVAALRRNLREVTGIAELIAGVAGQTNLLALNATIEAARAGAAGRGFGVVATEVKSLATETADSTTRITATVDSLDHDVAAVSDVITRMIDSITGIADSTATVSRVSDRERVTVERLGGSVGATIARIEEMSRITERLQRRTYERVAVTGTVQLRKGTVSVPARLMDVSEVGLRCLLDRGAGVHVGDTVRVELTVQTGDVQTATAEVVRLKDGANGADVALAFGARPTPEGLRIYESLTEFL